MVLDLAHHPYRTIRRRKDGLLEAFFDFGDKEVSGNRQQIGDCFFLCHNFGVLNVKKVIYSNVREFVKRRSEHLIRLLPPPVPSRSLLKSLI